MQRAFQLHPRRTCLLHSAPRRASRASALSKKPNHSRAVFHQLFLLAHSCVLYAPYRPPSSLTLTIRTTAALYLPLPSSSSPFSSSYFLFSEANSTCARIERHRNARCLAFKQVRTSLYFLRSRELFLQPVFVTCITRGGERRLRFAEHLVCELIVRETAKKESQNRFF